MRFAADPASGMGWDHGLSYSKVYLRRFRSEAHLAHARWESPHVLARIPPVLGRNEMILPQSPMTEQSAAASSHGSESPVTDKLSLSVQTVSCRWAPGRRPSVLFTDIQPTTGNKQTFDILMSLVPDAHTTRLGPYSFEREVMHVYSDNRSEFET